ncbi:MAG: diphthine--ammonia ligase [archaeon]
MKLGILFSGGKDSTLAAWLAKKGGHEICCLISIYSENKDSYMFHTPSISCVKIQAKVMNVPLIFWKTEGFEERELLDLREAIVKARDDFGIEGIVTGAVGSVYQASRVDKICSELGLKVINPLWGMEQIELLKLLVSEDFEVIISGVAAYPLDSSWLGRKIDSGYIEDVKRLWERHKINPAGEGGEFESFVLNCPLFSRKLEILKFGDSGEGNQWRRELVLK